VVLNSCPGQGLATGRPRHHDNRHGDAETKRQALEKGADALLTKPIDFTTLRGEIEARLEGPA
jgi:CheY-like chemotaxis protein